MSKKPRRMSPQDATRRNVRASNAKHAKAAARLKALEARVTKLEHFWEN